MRLITVVLLWFELPAKRHLPIGQLKNRARLSPGLSDTTFFVRYEGHVRKFRWFRQSNNNNKNCCSGSSSSEKQKKPQRSLILGCLCRQPSLFLTCSCKIYEADIKWVASVAERAVEALGPIFQGQPWPQFSIFSRWSRVQILGHACKLGNWLASYQLGFLTMLCSFWIISFPIRIEDM